MCANGWLRCIFIIGIEFRRVESEEQTHKYLAEIILCAK